MTRRTLIAILAAVVVIVMGAAVILTVVASTADDGGQENEPTGQPAGQLSNDERDATWACTVVNELPDPMDQQAMDITQPPLHRAIAAGALAWAASNAADRWAELQEPGKNLISGASTLDSEQLVGAVADLQTLCQDVSTVSFEGDIELSCDIVGALPDDLAAALEDNPIDSPVLWDLTAVGSLGKAAEYGDKEVPPELAEAASDLTNAVNTIDVKLAVESAATIREHCADQD